MTAEAGRQTVLAQSAVDDPPEINIGVMLALSPSAEVEPLRAFARQLATDVTEALLMLFVETYIFPAGLISTWPTLPAPRVTLWDKIRLASFISSVGVLTGALAGGLESRTVIRHLALFPDEP